jgi:hypothetical protein
VFYPVFAHRRVLGLLRELIGVEDEGGPGRITVYFLFRGDEPLEITIHSPHPETVVVLPQPAPRVLRRLQRAWWSNYTTVARLQERSSDYPPIVETYLTNMLSHRLGLATPLVDRRKNRTQPIQQESLQLVFNVESLRLRTMEQTLNGGSRDFAASEPVPHEIAWPARSIPDLPASIEVEPIALRVPEECFYIRFGSFDNYLWLKRLLERNGGSVGRMVVLRGHDAVLSERTQQQLGLKESQLAGILGSQLISDVALIGRDTYLREGGAIGILFEARRSLLQGELMKQRRAAVDQFKESGATLREEKLNGQTVSVASTADNRLRSYYAVVDNYHLVTNSIAIAERFIAAAKGDRPLGRSVEFQ